jgi:AraC-like DNA-binding protein
MMADDLSISKHRLSQAINSGRKKNFYKFINEFRIEEVKDRLSDSAYAHYSILGIALECGFNSKTSFNRIFKEETGLTPTEFLRTL